MGWERGMGNSLFTRCPTQLLLLKQVVCVVCVCTCAHVCTWEALMPPPAADTSNMDILQLKDGKDKIYSVHCALILPGIVLPPWKS